MDELELIRTAHGIDQHLGRLAEAITDAPDSASRQACLTCRGVLGLRDRLLAQAGTGGLSNGGAERLLAEARWLLAVLWAVKPCPVHHEAMDLARQVAREAQSHLGEED